MHRVVRTHYQVLGVPAAASHDEIRRAHRRLAHVLHPDRHLDASNAEQALAERRMREVNQAWFVLSDTGRRSAYDMTLRLSPPRPGPTTAGASGATASHVRSNGASPPGSRIPPTRSAPDPDDPDDLDVHPGTFSLLRRGPLVAVIVVALGIFVLSAYAGNRSDDPVREVSGEACVRLYDGSSGALIDCSLPNDGEVLAEVEAPLDCPDDTRYAQVGTEFFCIPSDPG